MQVITLLPFQAQHLEFMRAWAQDERLEEFFRRYPPLFAWNSDAQIQQSFGQAYVISADEKPIGLLTLSQYDPQNKKVEIGLLLSPEHKERRGFTFVEACRQAAEMVFHYMGYNKIYALVLPDRQGLKQVMASYGFKKEGELRDNCFWKGRFWDEDLYAITREDFERGN
jgi:RimJ/RimL family protein N-acetyltransferase